MSDKPGSQEETVVVCRAGSREEATVIRGLLKSAGIESPQLAPNDPYPLSYPHEYIPGDEILVRESQVEEARAIIAAYLTQSEPGPEDPAEQSDA